MDQPQEELSKLETHEKELMMEIRRPTVKEVSFQQLHRILSSFSRLLKKAEPEKQKELLHSIINKIIVNQVNSPAERSIIEIELFFDASLKDDEFVLTCGTVHRAH